MSIYEDVGFEVFEQAQEIFEACGAGNDFAYQSGLVFGGWNRIILTSQGWRADAAYCRPEFLQAFNEKYSGVTAAEGNETLTAANEFYELKKEMADAYEARIAELEGALRQLEMAESEAVRNHVRAALKGGDDE